DYEASLRGSGPGQSRIGASAPPQVTAGVAGFCPSGCLHHYMSRSNGKSPHLPSSPEGGMVPEHRMNRVKLLLVSGLYVATLLWAYATIVSREFAYEGFALTWPGAVQMAGLITLALLPALLLP